jgi:flavorubredoxin
MAKRVLFQQGEHRNVMLEDFGPGTMVQVNQHLIVHGNEGVILDPGGHKTYTHLLGEVRNLLGAASLKYIFLSHQDPDIGSSAGALMSGTGATTYISKLWTRFIPHFGYDADLISRIKGIPDEGMVLPLGGLELLVLPAHFLHSPGNFHLYDPVSRFLYSGDVGASFGEETLEVQDFDAHLKFMEGMHRRYMASNRALRAWTAMARTLDIEAIVPQHGGLFRGKALVGRFLDWCDSLACGVDFIDGPYRAPKP